MSIFGRYSFLNHSVDSITEWDSGYTEILGSASMIVGDSQARVNGRVNEIPAMPE